MYILISLACDPKMGAKLTIRKDGKQTTKAVFSGAVLKHKIACSCLTTLQTSPYGSWDSTKNLCSKNCAVLVEK